MLDLQIRAVTRSLRLIHLLLAAGVLTSCGSSGDWTSGPDRQARGGDIPLAHDADVIEARVPANATLSDLLRKYLPDEAAESVVSSVRSVFNPRQLRADRTFTLTRSVDGLFREFSYQIDADRLLRVVLEGGGDGAPVYDAEVVPVPKEVKVDALEANVTTEHPTLVGALGAFGENVQLALDLADVFGGVVDFNSDLQPGDRVDVLFDRVYRNGEPDGYGDVKAAMLDTGGQQVTAIRYVGADGRAGWYDEHGRSLRRQFLRSPLPFEPRITSRFSYRRLNPVNGGYRPHLGVDYHAAMGTRVMAVAAGVVESAGWAGEAGRMVKLRHGGGYETEYLHLSAFAKGIHAGVRVDQGQLIGYVGMSGTATGPHLDYRIIKNGVHVNPVLELSRMPPGEPISAAELPGFEQTRDDLLAQLHARIADAAAHPPEPAGRMP
jgi:murein DD-endopeptidase MepM/ murein hydrolase activator NlpD